MTIVKGMPGPLLGISNMMCACHQHLQIQSITEMQHDQHVHTTENDPVMYTWAGTIEASVKHAVPGGKTMSQLYTIRMCVIPSHC